MKTAAAAAVLVGAIWVALAFLALALFFALTPSLGFAGAAAVTGGGVAVLVVAGVLIADWRMRMLQRNALLNGLLSSGVISALAGFAGKRPLMTLGLGGIAAALWARANRPDA